MTRIGPILISLLLLTEIACSRSSGYYFDKAGKLAAEGKTEEAILTYRKAIQKDNGFGEAYFRLGCVLSDAHKPQEAYLALSRAVELLPRRDDVKVKLADLELRSYVSDQRHPAALYDKVTVLSSELLAANGASYDGLRLQGDLDAARRDYRGAEDLYSQANAAKPMQPELLLHWTEILLADKRDKEAEQRAFDLIAHEKSYSPIYDLLYKYYVSTKRTADAENILKTKVANNPANSAFAVELASFYGSNSREDEMKRTLQRLLDAPATFPDARLQAGELYASLQRWDDALRQFEDGTQREPKRRVTYLKKIADVWLAEGKGEQANRTVDEILKQLPHDPSARGVKASLLLSTGKRDDVTKAAADLKILVGEDPKNAVWHFNLGRALAAKGDLEGARAQFQEAVNLQKGFLQPRLALLELAQARRDYKASLFYAEEILGLHPDLLHIRVARAVSLVYTGKSKEGLDEFAALERDFPDDSEVRMQFAAMELHEKKFKEAEDHFRKLVKAGEDSPKIDTRAVNGLVETLAAENQPDKAIAVLQDELKASPDSIAIRSILARTAALEGKYDLAAEQYQRLLALAPNSEPTCLALGITYRMKGDFPDAISYLQKAHTLDPKDPVATIRLAGVLALTGRRPDALVLYRSALKTKPEDAATWSNAAYLIAETGGSLDEAMTFAQKAVKLDAAQPVYADTVGWIYFRKHSSDNAIQVFRTLTRKYPGDSTFHYHLGLALLQQGNNEPARAELKNALAGKPSDEVRHNAESALATMSPG